MLKDLKILNGILELKFNEYTYEYTVAVSNDIESLEIEYILDENSTIEIRSNNFGDGDNIVYLDVYDEKQNKTTYTLYIYKENSENVSGIDNYVSSLSVMPKEELQLYKVQILSITLFLIIIIIFTIMFNPKKKKSYK